MLDVCFGDSTKGNIKFGLEKEVYDLDPFLSDGILGSLDYIKVVKNRRGMFGSSIFSRYVNRNTKNYESIIKNASKGEDIRIWVADNADNLIGLCCLCYALKNYSCNVYVVSYPRKDNKDTSFGLVEPRDIPGFLEGNVDLLSKDKIEKYSKIWERIVLDDKLLRVKDGDNIVSVEEDYYDEEILSLIDQPMSFRSALGHVLGNMKEYVADGFIEERLNALIESGKLKMENDRVYAI